MKSMYDRSDVQGTFEFVNFKGRFIKKYRIQFMRQQVCRERVVFKALKAFAGGCKPVEMARSPRQKAYIVRRDSKWQVQCVARKGGGDVAPAATSRQDAAAWALSAANSTNPASLALSNLLALLQAQQTFQAGAAARPIPHIIHLPLLSTHARIESPKPTMGTT